MTQQMSRRDALRALTLAGAGLSAPTLLRGMASALEVGGRAVDVAVWTLGPTTLRITVRPASATAAVPLTGAVLQDEAGTPSPGVPGLAAGTSVRAGDLTVRLTESPPVLQVLDAAGGTVQRLTLDAAAPTLRFLLPRGPLLGMGEGGAQFDRKGAIDDMRNGQGARMEGPGAYRLATHGTRAPVQWLIGTTDGWALFIHQPYGRFDLTGTEGVFTPTAETTSPLDVFVVASKDPQVIMREYARITGLPELPPRWAFGYMQSSRTLHGPEEILGVAQQFRERRLPCDALIYLGTEFAPSGWNTRNGEFTWHPENFPDPKVILDQLHARNFRVIVHAVIEGRRLLGRVSDECTADPLPSGRTEDDRWPPERQVACYWPVHRAIMDVGVDGWWPDQGDGFDGPSRFNRHRMYYEGPQLYRPDERPFALHRNASPGIQRFGGFIWSGDPSSRWETLSTHVPVGINTGLSGLPFWGSDIGGFVPTDEYTGELHVRWFQFGCFCASFRAHGRNWYLKLPWGWGESDGGPFEAGAWRVAPEELNNPAIEPILKRYLELRYRLLPYTYTAVREAHDTGMPLMRALWLHFPEDDVATARGDEFLWGPDILVAPVVEKGATTRTLYLPHGDWYDFWTEQPAGGGREITRAVDLATMPLYVRAGAVLPLGPVRQYADEPTTEPTTLVVFPGASRTSRLYDDDGISFAHRRGEYMRLEMHWDDGARRLALRLEPGSRLVSPPTRNQSPAPPRFTVRLAGRGAGRTVTFTGDPLDITL